MSTRHELATVLTVVAAMVIGCSSVSETNSGTAIPSIASANPVSSAPFTADPCSFLTNEQASGIIGREVRGEAHLSGLATEGMRDCLYLAGGFNWYLILSSRQLLTSASEGRAVARELFGPSMSASSPKSAPETTIYTGRLQVPVPDEPAVAISSAPYFVVLFRANPRSTTPEDAYQALADLVLDSLAPPLS